MQHIWIIFWATQYSKIRKGCHHDFLMECHAHCQVAEPSLMSNLIGLFLAGLALRARGKHARWSFSACSWAPDSRKHNISEAPVAPDKARHHLFRVQGLRLEKTLPFWGHSRPRGEKRRPPHKLSKRVPKRERNAKRTHFYSSCFQARFWSAFLNDFDTKFTRNVQKVRLKTTPL